tara:strand:+ start:216 stop:377 length:162 start_codon:yes stop_codon:yes gene_type:complete
MNNIKSLATFSLPAALGLGVAWLGFTILKNEARLETRRMELEVQLNTKSIKGF